MQPLWETLKQFEDAKTFGSLTYPIVRDASSMRHMLEEKGVGNNLFLRITHEKVLRVLNMADYLNLGYHVVVANPPYMGNRGINPKLIEFINDHYKAAKSDLFAAFLLACLDFSLEKAYISNVVPFVWMFLTSYEQFRAIIFSRVTITSLIQLEYNAFSPAAIPVCAFSLINFSNPFFKGNYIRLSDFKGATNQPFKTLEAIDNPDCGWHYLADIDSFKNVPGFPVAYWLSRKTLNLFNTLKSIGDFAQAKQGLITGDNGRFLRFSGQKLG